MPRQNRGYKRGAPHRDARLFVIVCEGAKREKEYFEFFQQYSQRIKIEVLPPINNRSAPNHFLSRATDYQDAFGLITDDHLWFVSDRDRWEEKILRNIHEECEKHSNWQLAISNPCFEVWLLLHLHDLANITANSSGEFKRALNQSLPGGYQVALFAPKIEDAIQRAKAGDPNPDYFLPDRGATKLYQLAEQMLGYMGREWKRTS